KTSRNRTGCAHLPFRNLEGPPRQLRWVWISSRKWQFQRIEVPGPRSPRSTWFLPCRAEVPMATRACQQIQLWEWQSTTWFAPAEPQFYPKHPRFTAPNIYWSAELRPERLRKNSSNGSGGGRNIRRGMTRRWTTTRLLATRREV